MGDKHDGSSCLGGLALRRVALAGAYVVQGDDLDTHSQSGAMYGVSMWKLLLVHLGEGCESQFIVVNQEM